VDALPVARNRFRWHGSDATKARVAKLFPEQDASRASVIAGYAPSLPSLMPEGLEAALPAQAMADLLAWLRE
jgi:hypothetical protein